MALGISKILDANVNSITRLRGGRNSRVYTIKYGDSNRCIAKRYPQQKTHERDRLNAEYGALMFLQKHGVTCVPEPIGIDRNLRYALYEYIEGESIKSGEISNKDIDQSIRFLQKLRDISPNTTQVDCQNNNRNNPRLSFFLFKIC